MLNRTHWSVWSFVMVAMLLLASCSSYQRLLKSDDLDDQYKMAIHYYETGDYYKALQLFDQLNSYYRGSNRAEKIMYYTSYCHYAQGDYVMASYYFKNFFDTFPNSPKAEECLFMKAFCKYLDSPRYSLDQSFTLQAIEELHFFTDRYPRSKRVSRNPENSRSYGFILDNHYYEKEKSELLENRLVAVDILTVKQLKRFARLEGLDIGIDISKKDSLPLVTALVKQALVVKYKRSIPDTGDAFVHYLHTLDEKELVTFVRKNRLEVKRETGDSINAYRDKVLHSMRFQEDMLTCNELIDNLWHKLEKKEFENCYIYYRIEDYKAAIHAFRRMLNDYPETDYKEEVMYLVMKANFLYASKSVPDKQEERYLNTKKALKEFITNFPESKHLKEAQGIFKETERELEKIEHKNT